MEDHFRKLFVKHEGNIDEVMTKKDLPITHELNQNFTMEELKQSIKNMDYKKAVGPDGIANAFLKHPTDELLEILLKFLNLNIKHGMASSN